MQIIVIRERIIHLVVSIVSFHIDLPKKSKTIAQQQLG